MGTEDEVAKLQEEDVLVIGRPLDEEERERLHSAGHQPSAIPIFDVSLASPDVRRALETLPKYLVALPRSPWRGCVVYVWGWSPSHNGIDVHLRCFERGAPTPRVVTDDFNRLTSLSWEKIAELKQPRGLWAWGTAWVLVGLLLWAAFSAPNSLASGAGGGWFAGCLYTFFGLVGLRWRENGDTYDILLPADIIVGLLLAVAMLFGR